ncbi:MAG TPA: dihydrolipoamide acetyltransferase family protein [Steroidobacteraceae bacterium]|nr:dihydrolipoamide acetyltransferase family protein [Steroidobacteraceae bacterium]
MANEFRMPSLGPDMEAGTLVAWKVHPGDAVKRGDVVALVETDKGVIDVEIFATGTIEKLLVEPGTHVPVGTVLAQLKNGEASSEVPAPPAPASSPETVGAPQVTVHAAVQPPAARHQRISPAARVRAHALGLNVDSLRGTGPGGVITLDDVSKAGRANAKRANSPSEDQVHDMRRIIAKAMTRSKHEIPHYYLSIECCFSRAQGWLDQHNAAVAIEERLLPSALVLKAVALAARAMPEFNGFYKDEQFQAAADVHAGMAIAMRGGRLVAPAILNADRKPLAVIMSELRDLTTRVRSGHMRAAELALSTITITSLAEEGVDLLVPVIYPPQVAIVGCGSIVERPWIVDGLVQPARVMTITLAADHRVTDGRAGARFLRHVHDSLQSPEKL